MFQLEEFVTSDNRSALTIKTTFGVTEYVYISSRFVVSKSLISFQFIYITCSNSECFHMWLFLTRMLAAPNPSVCSKSELRVHGCVQLSVYGCVQLWVYGCVQLRFNDETKKLWGFKRTCNSVVLTLLYYCAAATMQTWFGLIHCLSKQTWSPWSGWLDLQSLMMRRPAPLRLKIMRSRRKPQLLETQPRSSLQAGFPFVVSIISPVSVWNCLEFRRQNRDFRKGESLLIYRLDPPLWVEGSTSILSKRFLM